MDSTDRYWASLEDPAEFGQKLKQVIEENAKAPVVQTVLEEQRNAYLQLFSVSLNGTSSSSRVLRDGQEGELAAFRVPLAAALANAVVNLVTGQKITWQATATKSDAAARAQTTLGNQALEVYWHDRGGEQFLENLVREGVPFGEAFGFIEFDPLAGEMVTPPIPGGNAQGVQPMAEGAAIPGGQPAIPAQYEGDIRFNVVSSWDVARDPRAKSFEECDWLAVRLRRNRFDLAARYGPEVLDACGRKEKGILPTGDDEKTRSDLVDCWYWFHRKTPSVALGRQAVIIGDKAFALDRLRYDEVPVVRYFTGNLTGTPLPFAPFWTALASQELQDSLLSALATNNLAFGTQMVAVTAGSEIEPESVGPMRLLTVPQGGMEPKGINLTQSSPESFKLYELLKADQRQLLGLNGTVLGQPEGANLSGAAMALLSSMAMQANSSPQATYVQCAKQVGNILLGIWQKFFTTERKIQVAGKSMTYMAREVAFSAERVAGVSGVSVRVGNPLAQTVAGREAIVDKYMQIQRDSQGAIQLIKTPEDLQQLLDTGRIDGLTDPLRDQALLVEAENEALARGEPVKALLGDDDVYHCKHHRSVVTSIEARSDDGLLMNALEHVHQHYENFFGVPAVATGVIDPVTGEETEVFDPMYRQNMMVLFGLQPPAPPAMAPPGDPAAPPPVDGDPAEPVDMPQMPENPMTGEQFDPQTGGGVVALPGA